MFLGGKKTKKSGKAINKPAHKPKIEESPNPSADKKREKPKLKDIKDEREEEESDDSDISDVDTIDNNEKSSEEDTHKSNNEDDDQEWEKFRKIHEREKSLEGKSKTSHSVHCPLFPYDKQEYWWTYICDRKSKTLLTAPYHITNLVDKETIHLKVS